MWKRLTTSIYSCRLRGQPGWPWRIHLLAGGLTLGFARVSFQVGRAFIYVIQIDELIRERCIANY